METSPILVTRVLGSEESNIDKKLLPFRPKTVLGSKKRNKKEWQLLTFLRYTQTQQEVGCDLSVCVLNMLP